MNRFKLALVYILLVPWSLSSQLDSMHRFKMVSGLSKFRDELMADTCKALAFGVLSAETKRLAEKTSCKLIFNYMWPDLFFMGMDDCNPYRYASAFDEESVFRKMNIHVDQINNENHYLRSAINYGFFEREYPFKINKNIDIEKELGLLQIQMNDRIFDYGPGMMCLAPILCSIYDSIIVYQALTLQDNVYVYIKNFTNKFRSFKSGSKIELKKIAHYTFPLFEGTYDKIIINYPLQNKDDLTSLFKAAKLALKPNGYLFIMQLHACDEITNPIMETISNDKIIRKINKSGFIVETRLSKFKS